MGDYFFLKMFRSSFVHIMIGSFFGKQNDLYCLDESLGFGGHGITFLNGLVTKKQLLSFPIYSTHSFFYNLFQAYQKYFPCYHYYPMNSLFNPFGSFTSRIILQFIFLLLPVRTDVWKGYNSPQIYYQEASFQLLQVFQSKKNVESFGNVPVFMKAIHEWIGALLNVPSSKLVQLMSVKATCCT